MPSEFCRPPSRPMLSFALAALMVSSLATAADPLLPAAQAPAAPACKLTVQGEQAPAGLDKFLGQVLYVDFWASWCGPCRQSFPFMNQLQSALGAKGLSVVAINLDEEATDAQTFLASHAASFKVVGGANQECAAAFHVEAMPSSYLIDRAGKVRYIHHGFRAGDAELLQGLAASLVAEPAATP